MSMKDQDTAKALIVELLKDMNEATTAELIKEAEMLGIKECSDRIPAALAELASEGKISKHVSREKKALIWTLG
ncbi:MAG: hypothetical protein JSV04_05560 [Candidatus Heimdallarchaeota archaeon]|nr:MAG: hypothetical protein JSV04_05560 [Candidatus Heimdallarchaeota archaeon]